MLSGPPRLVCLLALAGCFVDTGGTATTDITATTTTSETSTGTTADPTTTTTTTTSTTTTSGASSPGEASGPMSSTGEVCEPLARLAMTTDCVKGLEILSVEWGNTRCTVEFGPEWSWIEHHYQGGWGVTGIWADQESLGLRGWTHITNQPSECFSTGGTTGVTWVHTPCTATCDADCDAYNGDTPCGQCLPLICVSAI